LKKLAKNARKNDLKKKWREKQQDDGGAGDKVCFSPDSTSIFRQLSNSFNLNR
jgi:hypothetical protein